MPGKAFTPEEIRILSENPNTFEVSTYRLAFTKEAKERILELSASGKSARSIVIELGYDPEMLGDSRVKNIAYYVRLDVGGKVILPSLGKDFFASVGKQFFT